MSDLARRAACRSNPQHAAVALSSGLLERLTREEVAGVLANEFAHVRNHDTLTMTVTATIAGANSAREIGVGNVSAPARFATGRTSVPAADRGATPRAGPCG